MDGHLRDVDVKEIWIDNEGRLCVRLADESLVLSHIYRASPSGVEWDQRLRALCSPVPREWSYAEWFGRIVEAARNEYELDLVLTDSTAWRDISNESRAAIELARAQMPPYARRRVDDRTMARYVGDNVRRREARELFLKRQWKAAIARLESLQYPQFMDAADKRRLEIAKRRSEEQPTDPDRMDHRHPLNTRAIQAARALNYRPDQRWVDWAERLLVEGTDTPGLRVMAGLLPPFNPFEVTQLLDRTLSELGVPALRAEEAPDAYAHALVAGLVEQPENAHEALEQLSQLCIATDYASALMSFYLLHHARGDLATSGEQHYWDGADGSNIDQIIREEARRWLQARSA